MSAMTTRGADLAVSVIEAQYRWRHKGATLHCTLDELIKEETCSKRANDGKKTVLAVGT